VSFYRNGKRDSGLETQHAGVGEEIGKGGVVPGLVGSIDSRGLVTLYRGLGTQGTGVDQGSAQGRVTVVVHVKSDASGIPIKSE
jgi:hypothetical protein